MSYIKKLSIPYMGSKRKGNGLTIWNRAKQVHGDYETIAHISTENKITYYIKNLPQSVIDYVESFKNKMEK